MDPLPGYVGDWLLARWIGGGTTAEDIEAMPVHRVAQARIVMSAIHAAEREAQKQPAKGGRKR
jgi:hypothetical protein